MQTPEHTKPNGVEEQQIFGQDRPFFLPPSPLPPHLHLHAARMEPGACFWSMKQGFAQMAIWCTGAFI